MQSIVFDKSNQSHWYVNECNKYNKYTYIDIMIR